MFLAFQKYMNFNSLQTYFASKNEAQQNGYGELTMAKEDDVEQIRVGGFLQEEPE